MCCAEEVESVRKAITALPGVQAAQVLLAAEKAIVRFDPARVDIAQLNEAVASAGCTVASPSPGQRQVKEAPIARGLVLRIFTVFGLIFGAVLFTVVLGEMFGVFRVLTEQVPWPIWLVIIGAGGYPVLRDVLMATLRRKVTSHTLMTAGLVAAIIVGEWPAAVLLVFFMRIGNYVERFTAERVRRSVKELTSIAPQQASVERAGAEIIVPVQEVQAGDVVIMRPGEQIPVDGEVIGGQATVNQATITGESIPLEVGPGSRVFAATLCNLGTLRVRATRVGVDTTFGRIVKLVEETETHRAEVQRYADKVSGYYLPVVALISILTFVIGGNIMAAAAVLVVACSCVFAIATPIAMMASIGASARKGLLIKGGRYLESLARADVVLLDKTGTLTMGHPRIADVITLNEMPEAVVLQLAATVERYSEHPLAEAVRTRAAEHGLEIGNPEKFEAIPGVGARALVDGKEVFVGSRRAGAGGGTPLDVIRRLEAEGKTLLFVTVSQELTATLAAADTMRAEILPSIASLRRLGVRHIELLTGDNERTAAALAASLGIAYRAGLLPEDKISIVKTYQAQGKRVVMVGDGVNDAPALAQADVGIAMGATGSDVAIEAADVVLMREDWRLVPEVFQVARRTMGVVRVNIWFTAVYNIVGLSLAALGILPLVIAAAAQSLPDLGMMLNSSRLLRIPSQKGKGK
jgi:Cd2+/Zn2+-exporting ATPase/Cu+-exporting ATPase